MTDKYWLAKGPHDNPAGGRCAMEWVAYLAGEKHTDKPACVSPVLRLFCISLNDRLTNDLRQKLRPYLARTIGTADDGRDQERIEMCKAFVGTRPSVGYYRGWDPVTTAAYDGLRTGNIDGLFDLLDRMLPTVPLELPAVEEPAFSC